jgi:hypothetical protein
MSQFPLFVGGAYTSQSPIADDEQLMNWYVEVMESPGAVTRATLYPTPGFSAFSATDSSGGRAMFALNGRCFAIVNVTLYEITSDGTATVRGTVATDGFPATICGNGDAGEELFITSGDVGYVYDLSADTLSTVVASGSAMGGMLDGYFVSLNPATSQFRISDLNDGTTWDVTQFAARSIAPDSWTSMVVTSYGQIWLFGSQTSEVWYNAGTAPFPFVPDPSGLIPYGCAARFSAKEAIDRVVWLATSASGGFQVVEARGFTPTRISTHAVEYAISQYSDVSDALADVYESQGHLFYVLTFPTAQVTWCYDFTTRLWHERGSWDASTSTWKALRTMFGCTAFNKRLVADRQGGSIYTQSITLTEDAGGDLIRRVRRSPAVFAEHQRVRFADIEVFLESGLGTTSGQGVNPQVTLRASNDGGKTWGNERSVSAGAQGDYRTRVRFRRLGISRDRVFEMSVTDPIPWRIVDAFMTVAVARTS